MSESYMKKGLEAQKPMEVMEEGLRFYAGEFLRWGIGKPAEDTPLTLAAVKLMLPLLEGQLDRITHVLSHADGLSPGYVVLSIRENK